MIPLKIPKAETPAVLMTCDEARSALRLGRKQFDDLRKAGLLKAVKLGRSVRIVAASVHELPARLSNEEAA